MAGGEGALAASLEVLNGAPIWTKGVARTGTTTIGGQLRTPRASRGATQLWAALGEPPLPLKGPELWPL